MSKLLYICSIGHSGSTLTDMLCGLHPEIFPTGELMWLPWNFQRSHDADYPITNGARCSCSLRFTDCETWGPIIKELEASRGEKCLSEAPMERFPMMLIRKNVDYAKGKGVMYQATRELMRQESRIFKRKGPVAQWVARRDQKKIENNWELIDTIGRVFQSDWVTDSSKDPLRMQLLHAARPNDLKCVLLIRDLRGVVNSYIKLGRKDVNRVMLHWKRYYLSTIRMMRAHGIPFHALRYEMLCENSTSVLWELWKFCGLAEVEYDCILRKGEHHLVAGNGMRFKEEICVREDTAWHASLDADLAQKIDSYQKEVWQQLDISKAQMGECVAG